MTQVGAASDVALQPQLPLDQCSMAKVLASCEQHVEHDQRWPVCVPPLLRSAGDVAGVNAAAVPQNSSALLDQAPQARHREPRRPPPALQRRRRSPGKEWAIKRPQRDRSWTLSPDLRTKARKPSCFNSKSQPSAVNGPDGASGGRGRRGRGGRRRSPGVGIELRNTRRIWGW
jgi:hypothetical protein